MLDSILLITYLSALVISFIVLYKKHKHVNKEAGIKNYLTSICFYLGSLIGFSAYWFDLAGIISMLLMLFFLFLGAYFTKYLQPQK
ncbi:CHASE2 domain-containing sensor protein [Bacillus pakistanensis]|uniref:CHASE2 domain-containing sensor protein n=1 Tax=Rossellomorea pakistanensis TaxID=992288 RepID=A0ABS2N6R6_9BACI|nr:hypothetical protein [Bacillus pakistanensis]MBM7583500.1 CHASE2 domain-containing sensor protein [Bacillus pakistanensis]